MSYNKSLFAGVPKKNVNMSRFNLSHEYKAALTLGRLIPVLTMETLPGDEFTIDTEFMFRFPAMYFPIMHKVTMRADYYYIPNRILWPGDLKNIETTTNPGWINWINNAVDLSGGPGHPTFESEQALTNGLETVATYMGVPVGIENPGVTTTIVSLLNAFPLSAYLKIWDEYYRVPQLEDGRWFPLEPGINTESFVLAFGDTLEAQSFRFLPFSSKWEKDYFTSALPTPQIGDAILIPSTNDALDAAIVRAAGTGAPLPSAGLGADTPDAHLTNNSAVDAYIENQATIKQLRIAEVLQSYYERIMKVGQRYRDFIEGLWGIDPQPGDVDVPVLLGAKFGRVVVSDVMSQTLTIADTSRKDVGDYSGQANLYENGGETIRYKCHEHGWIMCILQVNPNTSYGQGIERFWRRQVPTDYPLDMFSGIGDQEILKEEVLWNYITSDILKNDETFGYIPRFSEMRYVNNKQIGRLNFDVELATHLGRIWGSDILTTPGAYDAAIEINADFVNTSNEGDEFTYDEGNIRIPDVFRVLPLQADETSDAVIYAHLFHSIYVNRELPMFSTPKSI